MEEPGCRRVPVERMPPNPSGATFETGIPGFRNHSAVDGPPKVRRPTAPGAERQFANRERPRPNVVGESFAKKMEKKRPMTFMERLKWLRKFPNANVKKKYPKPADATALKNSIEKRKALQHPKMFGAALANGNHEALKTVANANESGEYGFPESLTALPETFANPTVVKNATPSSRESEESNTRDANAHSSELVNFGNFHPSGRSPGATVARPAARPSPRGSSRPASFEKILPSNFNATQPSVTFKCHRCGRTSFENLEMLKEHQLNCSSQPSSSESALDSDRTNLGSANGGRATRKVFLCSACGTYFENWNLFLHMRDVHGRHICLFCLGLFSRADKLASHLASKHAVRTDTFKSEEELARKYTDAFYLMCCKCELVFAQKDEFATHECNRAIKQCSSCGTKGGHGPECPKRSKHKSGRSELDLNKKLKKTSTVKRNTEPAIDPQSEPRPASDKNRYDVFDMTTEKDISDLSPLDGIGMNELSALSSYAVAESKPEKISPSSMALLIEEVKNCLAQPPPLNSTPANADTVVETPAGGNNIPPVEIKKEPESLSSTRIETESHMNSPLVDTKISNVDDGSVNISSDNMLHAQKNLQPESQQEKEVNKVPKLTVKVPKITSEKESSDYSSESEDSDKLTVDLEPRTENTHINNVDRAGLADDADNKKTDMISENETPGEDIPIIELTLDRPLDKIPLKDLLCVLLNASIYSCIYCNHARRIAVDGKQLGVHFISQHKFTATVNSITAEELLPETIVSKIKTCLQDVEGEHINLEDFTGKTDPKACNQKYECFQCYYETTMHKDLYFHNRKMHQKTILLCIMCKSNFYTYSELICHLCPGVYILNNEMSFRCCICRFEPIPSAFRLMVHLRKRHHACDVCLETCYNQSKLSSHVWKHKLHHLCYRCGISYRNKPDITKHLFWKHGTESVLCKKCLQRKWPHVYHFCVPPNFFVCEECNLNFTKAVYLKVHKRMHNEEYPYECKEADCSEKFISKKMLEKHKSKHAVNVENDKPPVNLDNSSNVEVIDLCDKVERVETNDTKSKRSKKSKSFKDNILMDVNLPALNLSESGSSDDSDAEIDKKIETPGNNSTVNMIDENGKTETSEEPNPEPPVQGIWDNFNLYQQSLEKQIEKLHIPIHVCESDHDYCLIPSNESPDVEIVGETRLKPEIINITRDSPKKKTKASKKKNKSDTIISSSSDSSSDSDTSCSCGTNCSCSSSSGSSSSSSSSDSSNTSSQKKRNTNRKDSDASHTSAVDIMATEGSPAHISKSKEFSFAESDLDSDESATDEDFYDKHPEKMANKLLAEKRNQLIQSASTSPINNGTYFESSRPPTPEDSDKLPRKKIKVKKRKKEKKTDLNIESRITTESPNIPVEQQPSIPNKITISLQSNTVQLQETNIISDVIKTTSVAALDADNKRASKRRRVPNKFYGYSSDEELMLKPHQPPKLEWRKEDLPTTSNIQQQEIPRVVPESPHIPEIPIHIPEPPALIKSPPKESSSDDSDSSKEGALQIKDPYSPSEREQQTTCVKRIERANPIIDSDIPFPRPTGAREAREGESVYCYCRCPYDEVSEMIACDAEGCIIEWFHFECVGIMVPPKGKWFCPDCRVKQPLDRSDK